MEFLDGFTAVIAPYMDSLFAIMAVFTRMSVFIFLVPTLGERTISTRVRLGLALLLTFLMLPVVMTSPVPITQFSDATALIAKEAVFGFFFGFALRMMIMGLQVVGNIVSQAMSISQPLGEGIATEPNTTLSNFLMLAGVTLLITLNFHIEAFAMLIKTYNVFPLGSSPDFNNFAYELTHKAVGLFRWSLSLAFPFILLNFIYNLLLGFVNRAMPQLLVSFVGMPAILGIGLLLLAISATTILTLWLGIFQTEGVTFDLAG